MLCAALCERPEKFLEKVTFFGRDLLMLRFDPSHFCVFVFSLVFSTYLDLNYSLHIFVGWLVGCFGFNGPLRQYFSLYRAVSQREGERKEKG